MQCLPPKLVCQPEDEEATQERERAKVIRVLEAAYKCNPWTQLELWCQEAR